MKKKGEGVNIKNRNIRRVGIAGEIYIVDSALEDQKFCGAGRAVQTAYETVIRYCKNESGLSGKWR